MPRPFLALSVANNALRTLNKLLVRASKENANGELVELTTNQTRTLQALSPIMNALSDALINDMKVRSDPNVNSTIDDESRAPGLDTSAVIDCAEEDLPGMH
jgi:cell division GTPase FtsZ